MIKETEIYKRIKSINLQADSEVVTFVFEDDSELEQYHSQDCCENVYVSQVDGDPMRFIGAELYTIQEKIELGEEEGEYSDGTYTYTFYTAKTSKGYLDWRWDGSSNGYYSESVDCILKGKFIGL